MPATLEKQICIDLAKILQQVGVDTKKIRQQYHTQGRIGNEKYTNESREVKDFPGKAYYTSRHWAVMKNGKVEDATSLKDRNNIVAIIMVHHWDTYIDVRAQHKSYYHLHVHYK